VFNNFHEFYCSKEKVKLKRKLKLKFRLHIGVSTYGGGSGGAAKFAKRCDGNSNDRLTRGGMEWVERALEAEGKIEDEVGFGTVFCP